MILKRDGLVQKEVNTEGREKAKRKRERKLKYWPNLQLCHAHLSILKMLLLGSVFQMELEMRLGKKIGKSKKTLQITT